MKLTADDTDVEEPMVPGIPSSFAPDCLLGPGRMKRRPDHEELERRIGTVEGKLAVLKREILTADYADGSDGELLT